MADQWYVDEGDVLFHLILGALPYLQAFDTANVRIGAEPNPQKTEVICYVADLDAAPLEWRINDVRQYITDQLLAKADVIRVMHERVQLCQVPQTEFALLRESLAVSSFTVNSFPVLGLRLSATSLYLVAPTFCFCPCAVSFSCVLVTFHKSHSSRVPYVEILIVISTTDARDWDAHY